MRAYHHDDDSLPVVPRMNPRAPSGSLLIRSSKALPDFRTKLANLLSRASDRLAGQQQPDKENDGSEFVDLAPTDQADATGVYSRALAQTIANPRVMNIALTGPYGSGKSSIIASFLKTRSRTALQISLAAFLPESAPSEVASVHQVSRQEIERSILQQMLYGADANRLPLSRFKRIQSPGRWARVVSLFTVLGLVACWHLIRNGDALASGQYFKPFSAANWVNLLALAIGGGFLWLIAHQIYIASFGISLKSISLKDIQIEPRAATEESILNRHLDEIIYFFQSTSYDLVVIEDLDRFDNPEIFVTLREINGLVNANAGVKRRVRFLYALRDDIFASMDRTKFFEFIVPVIPIINSSNSIDKVMEQGRRLAIDDRLDKQFVREVSRYLGDLRLIRNIFNEYAIYDANLELEGETNLDPTKLLAILIYKNVFPKDFELLHRGRGNLAEVLRGRDRYVAASEARIGADIARLEARIEAGERQLPEDLHELRSIYAMAVLESVPDGYTHVGVDQGNMTPVNSLAKNDKLDALLTSDHAFANSPYNGLSRISLAPLQAKLSSGSSLAQREAEVEARSSAFRDVTARTIRELRTKLTGVRMTKFSEILTEGSENLDDLFEPFGDNADLARFLVLEGYLDDTYYQYTSLFHSGRLSPNDNRFLIRIRGFSNPDPGFQIDNPREVVAEMRDEDFGRNYVLNVEIVDCLLADPTTYGRQTARLLEFIASDFKECEGFLAEYYARGAHVPELISRLAADWRGFVAATLTSPASLSHVGRMLRDLPDAQLQRLADDHPDLPAFLAKKLPDVLALGIDIAPERLRPLRFEIADLTALEPHPGFVRTAFDRGNYELTIGNLEFAFRALLGVVEEEGPRQRNYTTVLETDSAPLLAKLERQFAKYLEEVLLRLPENRFEGARAIRRVLVRSDLEHDPVLRFVEMQTTRLPTLDEIPPQFHAALLRMGKIEPTWRNCLYYMGLETYDPDALTDFLDRPDTVAALGGSALPSDEAAFPLRRFIIGNDALTDEAYRAYLEGLPTQFKAFPKGLGPEKLRIIVDLKRVTFSSEALSTISEDLPLSAAFAANNIGAFLEIEDGAALSDDLRERLLHADIPDDDRRRILRRMDLNLLANNPDRAALVGSILLRTGAIEELGPEGARAVILNSHPLDAQIELFNMLHQRFDDEGVRDVLRSLPDPMPDIGPGWRRPSIPDSEVNRTFAAWLEARKFISSWKRVDYLDEIRMNLFRR